GTRPHTRQGCRSTNFRWSLSRRRTVLPRARIMLLRDRFLVAVEAFWLVSASAGSADMRFLSGRGSGGFSGAGPLGVPAGVVLSGTWPSLIVESLAWNPSSTIFASTAVRGFLAGRFRCAQTAA